ncbi:MAG: magnesium transporter [Phycisphaeraceae bacterium]
MSLTPRNNDLERPVREFLTRVDTTIDAELSVEQALQRIRLRPLKHEVIYFYVVDEHGALAGVVPTRRLLLSEPDRPIREIMQKTVVHLPEDATLEEALAEFAIHRLLALPVVDAAGQLMGVIDVRLYAEEAVDLAQANRADELFQMIGLSVEQARHGTALAGYRLRMPWLLCNIVSGVICAVIAAFFADVLALVVMLAMFIPLVLTLSESVSMQAMSMALQFLHRRQIPWPAVRRRVGMEWRTAVLLGVTGGVLVAGASLFFSAGGATHPAPVMLAAVAVSMLVSAMVGLGMPIALHALRLDPRVAAGPVVLMLADVMTTAVYLGLATLWLL